MRSLNLDDEYPSVTVLDCYSRKGRDDTLPLHPAVVEELRTWSAKKKLTPSQPLFHLRSATGKLRDTANMMVRDLAAAKKKCIEETKDRAEQQQRRKSHFLFDKKSTGLFADFHANRHTFILNLARADIHPPMAQTLARHTTINLTMNTYTHVNMEEKSRAVGRLQAPGSTTPKSAIGPTTGDLGAAEVSELVSNGVPNGVTIEAARGSEVAPTGTNDSRRKDQRGDQDQGGKMMEDNDLGVFWPGLAPPGMIAERAKKEVHLSGLEPETFGSVDRCSIQLS